MNPRQLDPQSRALPTELRPPLLVTRLEGLEPPTSGLEIRCSIQLSYRRKYSLPQRQSRNYNVVGARGFEPPTPCSQGRCANRAALRPENEHGRLPHPVHLKRTSCRCQAGGRPGVRASAPPAASRRADARAAVFCCQGSSQTVRMMCCSREFVVPPGPREGGRVGRLLPESEVRR